MNVLIQDLLAAAGHVTVACLNELPPQVMRTAAEAIDAGGWTELRISVLNEAAIVRLMMVNLDGEATELGRIDHTPH